MMKEFSEYHATADETNIPGPQEKRRNDVSSSLNTESMLCYTVSVPPQTVSVQLQTPIDDEISSSSICVEDGDHRAAPDSCLRGFASKAGRLFTLRRKTTRDRWSKKADFLLSVIGFAVDLANVWRFPYLCYRNGGGAFLVPYLLMLVFGGIPLFYMELALGQYIRKGAITSWGMVCPLLKGVGYSVVLVAFYTDWFYNTIIAWSLYYMAVSVSGPLPWTTCGNAWNTENCTDLHLKQATGGNVSRLNATGNGTNLAAATYPVDEYFFLIPTLEIPQLSYKVLGRSPDTNIEHLGQVQWPNVLSFVAVMVICYFSLWKGVHTSGKVVWFTAIFPYVVLSVLLVRGLTLEGSFTGIQYYVIPNLSRLQTAQPWIDAATQVFFSLGPGFGVLLAYASYNDFHNNVYRDALIVSLINSLTSLTSGFVVFSMLGYMAFKRGRSVAEVVKDDTMLAFSVYPEALVTLPGANVWSFIFFLMLVTLGLDSSFGGSEAVITALSDEFPLIARNRELFVLALFGFYCIIGILESTQGGFHLFYLFERMCVQYPILLAVFFETVCISWIYGESIDSIGFELNTGVDRFRGNIKEMLGFQPGIFWKVAWKYIAPVFIMFNIVYGMLDYERLELDGYTYPAWAEAIGWCLSATAMLAIPVVAVIQLLRAKGSLPERFQYLIQPSTDLIRPVNSEKDKNDNNLELTAIGTEQDQDQPTPALDYSTNFTSAMDVLTR